MRWVFLSLLLAATAVANPLITAGIRHEGLQVSTVTNWNFASTNSVIEFNVSGGQPYLLFTAAVAGTDDITDVEWNGESLTLITNAALSTQPGFVRVYMAGLVNPDSGTHNLLVTVSGDGIGDVEYAASLSLWSGVNQSEPYGSLTVNEPTDGLPASSPTELVVTSAAGEKVVSAVNVYQSNDPPLAAAPQTVIASTNHLTVTFGAAYTNSTGTTIAVPFTFDDQERYWIQAGLSLKPAN